MVKLENFDKLWIETIIHDAEIGKLDLTSVRELNLKNNSVWKQIEKE